MPHHDLERIIREEVQRHKREQLNEIFGWLKKLWHSITDSDWDKVERASNDPESGIPRITREKWDKAPRWQRDAWYQIAKEWLDIPEDAKREMLYKALSRRSSLSKFKQSWDRDDLNYDPYRGKGRTRVSSRVDDDFIYDDDEIELRRYAPSRRRRDNDYLT